MSYKADTRYSYKNGKGNSEPSRVYRRQICLSQAAQPNGFSERQQIFSASTTSIALRLALGQSSALLILVQATNIHQQNAIAHGCTSVPNQGWVYTAMKLNLRRKAKRRLPARAPEPLTVPNSLGHTWSMDFMSDKLHNNIHFRTFNVIDDYNRQVLGIDIGTSMPSLRVIRYLDQLAQCHGYPNKIRVDNGSEFTSSIFTDWAAAHGILVDYIKPDCPYQNAYIERFNRSYRNEVLDCYLFNNLNEVRQLTDEWIEVYNHERPHDSLNDMTPAEFKQVA